VSLNHIGPIDLTLVSDDIDGRERITSRYGQEDIWRLWNVSPRWLLIVSRFLRRGKKSPHRRLSTRAMIPPPPSFYGGKWRAMMVAKVFVVSLHYQLIKYVGRG
jgi:hypothetical protein